MAANPAQSGGFDQGRTDSAADLGLRVSRAGAAYLQGALLNPRFSEEHLEPILSNPQLPAATIQQIAGRPRWLTRYEVRRAVVMHRNAPRPLQMNLLHFLRWKDLVRVIEDRGAPAPVRRAAENLVRSRVEEMAVGEKIALARIASPGVIPALRAEPHPAVITALLGNARMSEDQVVGICSDERATAQVLSAVAGSSRWGHRYPVKMALLRHPRTPAAATLRFLDSLLSHDLNEIATLPRAPRLVRATARQILKTRTGVVDRDEALS